MKSLSPVAAHCIQRTFIIAAWIFFAAGFFAGPVLAGPFEFHPLGKLTGGTFSYATGVSADGKVVVGRSDNPSGNEAFRWTSGTGMVGLGDLSGGLFNSGAYGVSADGLVAVGFGQDSGADQAMRWTSGTGMVRLDPLPSSKIVRLGMDASSDGSVVVGNRGGGVLNEAFRWTSGTGTTGLGDLPGGDSWSTASGVSGDGSVVVGQSVVSGSIDMFTASYQAFRWTQGGGMVAIDAESANAVTADGSVIVGHGFSNEAIRWTLAGGTVDLGDLPGGGDSSVANGVSDDGRFIAGYSSATGGNRAFLWSNGTGMVNLRDYLIAHGATGLTGWQLRSANDISGDGFTIVGEGINPSGKLEAWVAVIPEPSTGILAVIGAVGAAALSWRARRRTSMSMRMRRHA